MNWQRGGVGVSTVASQEGSGFETWPACGVWCLHAAIDPNKLSIFLPKKNPKTFAADYSKFN